MKSPLSLSLLARRPYAKKKQRWNSPAHSAENQSIEEKKRPFILLPFAPLKLIEKEMAFSGPMKLDIIFFAHSALIV